ncbi:uncharacterized protein LOC134776374 isoform X2 [Penaeus indicus]|uniref:uncharacterized protein LOC134776374 isoform X2 n=1 Tax=Penaeus indicus TaxID=29960 RepID=UPI00300C46A8
MFHHIKPAATPPCPTVHLVQVEVYAGNRRISPIKKCQLNQFKCQLRRMKLSAAFLLGVATLVSCAPQDDNSGGFHNVLRNLFNSVFSFGRGDEDDTVASDDGTQFPLLPFLPPFNNPQPDDYPDNYTNETYHVHDVNGSKVEVNQTITKNTDDSGVFFHNVHVIRVVPEEDADAGTGSQDGTVFQEVPQEEPAKNQKPHQRRRRWLANFARSFVGDLLLRYYPAQAPEKEEYGELEELGELGEMRAPRLSYEGDTDVNFRTSNLRDEPDAQDFRAMSIRRDPKR